MFDRLISLINEDNFQKIKNLNILIVGIGGVGGSTFESLIRSGIENITIIDNDIVDITNLNRQILTDLNNVGKNKADVAIKRAQNINPKAKIRAFKTFLDESNMNSYLNKNYDYILDCCDTINTKFAIIEYCTKNKIKFVTCLGTAKKFHPELLSITTLDKTSYDPIARILRKKVKEAKINKKIIVISSTEKINNTKNNVLGSTSFVPNAAGLLISSYVINDTLKK